MAGRNHHPPSSSKRRHAPYPTPSPDDSRILRRVPPPESQPRLHPAILIEDRKAAQEREIQNLLLDNHRLAAAHVALKQDLAATQQEFRQLSSTAASVKAERDAEVRDLYEKARKMEAEVRSVDELSVELAQVRADVQKLNADRKELTAKLQEVEDELRKVNSELKQFPTVTAEIEAMHKEVQRGRAAIDYEKKMHASNLEYSQVMEKHKITITAEIQKLHDELANAEKRARAAAAAAAAANPSFAHSTNYGNHETGYRGNLYQPPYAVHQVQGGADASTQYGPGAMSYVQHGPYDMKQPYVHQ